MSRILLIGNPPAAWHFAQILPVARVMHEEGHVVDCLVVSPVTLQLMYHVPWINRFLCAKYFSELDEVQLISTEEGLLANANYYFMDDFRQSRRLEQKDGIRVGKSLRKEMAAYDRILIIYDGALPVIAHLLGGLLIKFGSRCFGRVTPLGWTEKMRPWRPDVYIPQETVEALGYAWSDSLMRLDPAVYREFDPGPNCGDSERGIVLTGKGTCESHMPFSKTDHYRRIPDLKKVLEAGGFKVCVTHTDVAPRAQMWYGFYSKYSLATDSLTVWGTRATVGRDTHLITTGKDPNLPTRLRAFDILRNRPGNVNDVLPEEIAAAFFRSIGRSELLELCASSAVEDSG